MKASNAAQTRKALMKVGFVETPLPIARLMVALARALPSSATVLDTGCGRGVFLQALLEKGFTYVTGIEYDADLAVACQKTYPQVQILTGDFLTYPFQQRFDLIIGNPPYVHYNALPEELRPRVYKLTGTAESDIYYAFILRALSLLAEGGELIYIVPYTFLYNTHARQLRKALSEGGHIDLIIDLDETRLFKGENPETLIFRFIKKRPSLNTIYMKVKQTTFAPETLYTAALEALHKRCANAVFSVEVLPPFRGDRPWVRGVGLPKTWQTMPLAHFARVGVGWVSGMDEAFRLHPDELIHLSEEEKKCLYPFAKAAYCRPFVLEGTAWYFILPPYVQNEEQLQQGFPYFYAKLSRYAEHLQKRYLPATKKWWDWQALRNFEFLKAYLSKKRLFTPALDRSPHFRFAIGEPNILPAGDVLFIQPYREEDIYWLAAYLNSRVFLRYYDSLGIRRGGRRVITQRLLESVPIPIFSQEMRALLTELSFQGEATLPQIDEAIAQYQGSVSLGTLF